MPNAVVPTMYLPSSPSHTVPRSSEMSGGWDSGIFQETLPGFGRWCVDRFRVQVVLVVLVACRRRLTCLVLVRSRQISQVRDFFLLRYGVVSERKDWVLVTVSAVMAPALDTS